MKNSNPTIDVANFMINKLKKNKYLYQEEIVYQIQNEFGDDFVYQNENGNLAIDKKVLYQFKKLTGSNIIWERGERCWRARESYDNSESRMQE